MDGTKKWSQVQGTVALDNTALRVYEGTYSLKITTEVPADYEGESRIQMGFGPDINQGKFGFEIFVQNDNVANMDIAWEFYFNLYDGTNLSYFGIRLDQANGQLQYRNSGGSWTNLSALSMTADIWVRVKLVVDTRNAKYDCVEVGSNSYDLSSYAFAQSSDSTIAHMVVAIRTEADSNTQRDTWFDRLSVTVREP